MVRPAPVLPQVLLMCGALSCTAANPDYLGQAATSCVSGERSCIGTRAVACEPSAGDTVLRTQACPDAADCQSGLCVPPTGATTCTVDHDCTGGRVCTVLVNPTHTTALADFCLAPQGLTEGGGECSEGQQCRSNLCLGAGGGAVGSCFGACTSDEECAVGTNCKSFSVTITGVGGTIHSCAPM